MNDFNNDIAIIGMACHYPGAPDIHTFWQNLVDGIESITRFSKEELQAAGVDPDLLEDPNYVPAYGWLDGIDQFDAPFFGLTPREAQLLDPQQRLFLMCAWTALEDAGVDPEQEKRPVGVFAGAGQPIYYQENILTNPELVAEMGAFQTTLSNDKDFLATRTSYKLNLNGPSLSVQTACSTSLVAVHLAIQSLLNGESDLALAGGSSIVTTGKSGYLYSNEGLFSPDGRCRAFDAQAGGMVGGDGVGVVILKRLEDAQAEGDTIYAVIKGSAVNNDGANKIGYTAPSVEGQAAVILEALAVSDVHPETITMIEAHGTGTPLGDPIEVAGLTTAFRTQTAAANYCALGSVKTNIGHTNAAAGVAGIIKTALALHHKIIPPSLNFNTPNPEIDFQHSPFYVNTKAKSWTAGHSPRRAGVSSFGLGGTNAHAIMEEAPPRTPSDPSRPYQLLTLSAKTVKALENRTADLNSFLQTNPDINLADVAFTLQSGRQRFRFRRTAVVQSVAEAVERLQNPAGSGTRTTGVETTDPPLAFIFPGGGAQYVNMSRDLYETEPAFRRAIDHCAGLIQSDLEQDLRHYIYPPPNEKEAAAEQLKRPSIGLPALFAVNYATAQLWISWGIQPQASMGHSLGEYTAACLAGVFSMEDALRLVVVRGQLFEQMPTGAMLSAGLPESAVKAYFDRLPTQNPLSIAAVNSPEQCVIAGTVEDLAQLEAAFNQDEIPFRRLAFDVAAHSVLVESILDQFSAYISQITLSAPKIPLVSTVSGDWLTAEQATDPNYWTSQLRQTVRFADGLETLLADDRRVILEVGPGQVLTTLARQNPAAINRTLLNSLRHPKQKQSDNALLMATLGRLWQSGVTVDWSAFYSGERRSKLSLPTYPFEKRRYWLNALSQQPDQKKSTAPRKNPNPEEWLYTPSWRRTPLPQLRWPENPANWLVFSDSHGMGAQIAERLRSAGQQVVSVRPGAQFEVPDDNNIVVNPERPQDYETLIAELKTGKKTPAHILHLWQWGPVEEFGRTDLDWQLNLGFFCLLHLTQALDSHKIKTPVDIAIVTSGMQEVTGSEPLAPERAAVIGPCKVIPFEYQHIDCVSIDAEFPSKPALAEYLLAECLSMPADHTEAVVAYRGRFRWQQTFAKVPTNSPDKSPPQLRERGVYMITGGLGGVGLALAGYLAQTAQARLVLLGRTGLPPRSTWKTVTDPLVREQIEAVLEMEAAGADVMVVSADVTDEEQMTAVFEQVNGRFGPINGLIHSAGIGGGGAIALKKRDEANAVLAAKVRGTQILHNLCRDDLDIFILCSSGASILGGFGQVDYCAANAVQDAYAPYRARNSGFCVSINWDAWQRVGLAYRTKDELPSDLQPQREISLHLGIINNAGHQVFHNTLHENLSQVVVSTYDFITRYQKLQNVAGAEVDEEKHKIESALIKPATTPAGGSRPELDTGYLAPGNKVEETVAARWQMLFGIEEIGVNDDFFALGGHSLLATQLLNRLRKDFPTTFLSLHDLFENPTIAAVATLIREQMERPESDKNSTNGEDSAADSPGDQLGFMTAYLQDHLSDSLDLAQIEPEADLLSIGLEANTADLIWRLQRDLSLRLYPQEILAHPTLASLAEYAANALKKQQNWMTPVEKNPAENGNSEPSLSLSLPKNPAVHKPEEKNPAMVFLLSAPRSGSTLLRLMLAGHPALFCPPELALLAYDSLSDWHSHQQSYFTQTGLHEALSTLIGLEKEGIQAKLDELSRMEHPVQATYRLLQETAAPRKLVDKTPGYALNPAVLERAEALFNAPKYIHLVRHPYPVIESFVRNRLHVVLGQLEANAAVLAETVWLQANQNLLNFCQQLHEKRYVQISFEELVKVPQKVMEQLCDFLDITYNDRVLHPYAGERMMAGPGDPDILQHDSIDPELGSIWQNIRLPWPLRPETQTLAAAFGYELPNERSTSKNVSLEESQIPNNLEELSDAEVDTLLRQLMEE